MKSRPQQVTGPLRVALIGNSFASKIQIPALRWAGGNQIIGLAGNDLGRARDTARRFGIEYATDHWQDLLELAPDLLLVSTPVDLHAPMVLAACDALPPEAAILCEKPMALDTHEARELTERAEGRPAFLDHQLRFSPHIRFLRENLERLGTPWFARVGLFLPGDGFATRPHSWWFDGSRGGGILGAVGSHLVDLLRHLLGEITAVRGDLRHFVNERPDPHGNLQPVTADTHASLSLRFLSRCVAEVCTGFGPPGEAMMELEIVGSEGAYRWTDGTELFASHGAAPMQRVEIEPPPTSEACGMLVDQGIFSRCLPLYLRELLDALRAARGAASEGRSPAEAVASRIPDAATFADGLAVQRVLDAARRSALASGGWYDVGA